jgi:xylose isomerase
LKCDERTTTKTGTQIHFRTLDRRKSRARTIRKARVSILKAKARQFDQDQEVQNLLPEIKGAGINTDVRLNADLTTEGSKKSPGLGPYNRATFDSIKNLSLDRTELTNKRLPYERLDQLTIDILLGVR